MSVSPATSRRIHEHREGLVEGFTTRYKVVRLVYYERRDTMHLAIQRGKNIKQWRRRWKLDLIRAIAWLTVVAAPVILLLQMQLTFLPYHNAWVTWLHRVCRH